ncbi:type IV secretion system DNA-binding domain-containing protein [Escherichia coli]
MSPSPSVTGCVVSGKDQKNGWLFISSNADTHASLKPVISMWPYCHSWAAGNGENRNRRVWFFCDELPTLHKLPDLVEICRKPVSSVAVMRLVSSPMPSWKISTVRKRQPRCLTS